MKLYEIKKTFGEVSVIIDGVKKNYKLKLFDSERFPVARDGVQNIRFGNIKGDIACKVDALGNKDDLYKNISKDLFVAASYNSENSTLEQTALKHSDVVKIILVLSFSPVVEKTVVLIGPDHESLDKGKVFTTSNDWQTPTGILKTDEIVVKKMIKN